MSKIVHMHVLDPRGPQLFKGMSNSRAEAHRVVCDAPDDCPLLPRGLCIARGMFSSCKYGRATREEGPTKRARGISEWVSKRKEQAASVGTLDSPPDRVVAIGEFVWLPYAHMDCALTGRVFCPTRTWIALSEFTPTCVANLCESRPRSVFGDEIVKYQSETVPKFVRDLSEDFPELLAEAAQMSERIRSILPTLSNVGRKAKLLTLVPNVGEFDIKGDKWTWDGRVLRAVKPSASLFQAVPGLVSIEPDEAASVVVAEDAQVSASTVFRD